jgi:hypothetical protein
MWCMCRRFNRHKLHLITYGFVSLSLMIFGMVFSGFAIFHKNSQIGKVWLAGPTTIVVGLFGLWWHCVYTLLLQDSYYAAK